MKTSRLLIIGSTWLLLACASACDGQSGLAGLVQGQLPKEDYLRFQGTPVWPLARAMQHDSCAHLPALPAGVNIDYHEPQFGETLLMTAVRYDDYACCAELLRRGASPNAHDTSRGESPMIMTGYYCPDGRVLTLLLAHGGNPSDVEVGERIEGNTIRNTPLFTAITGVSMPNLKTLVEAGADVNFKDEFGTTAFGIAIVTDRYNMALYLLEHGADFSEPVLNRDTGPVSARQLLLERAKRHKLATEGQRVLDFIEHH